MNKVLSNLCLTLICVSTCFSNAFSQTSCQDCPTTNYVFNNQTGIATLSSSINVMTTGADDLSINPLTAVRINLHHGWLSDVYVSLISPSGLHYVIMGDNDNTEGGCDGGPVGYADIRIVPGDFNPLTAGSTYYIFCSGGQVCLNGDFTVACNQSAFDPYNGASSTPNCDLAAYNQPGHTLSGTWTLLVNCVCPFLENNENYPLIDWGLDFSNPAPVSGDNNSCLADGGTFFGFNYQRCQRDAFTFNLYPQFQNGIGAPSDSYTHASFLVQNEMIVAQGPDYNNSQDVAAGIYEIQALSYENPNLDLDIVAEFIGQPISEMVYYMETLGLCYDWMTNPGSVEVLASPEPIYMTHEICAGECVELLGAQFCEAGEYQMTEAGASMCSDVNYHLSIVANENATHAELLPVFCLGETLHLSATGGTAYEWTGPNGFSSVLANPTIEATFETTQGLYQAKITTTEGCEYVYNMDFNAAACQELLMEETILKGDSKLICFDEIAGLREEVSAGIQPNFTYTIEDNCIRLSGANERDYSSIDLKVWKDGIPTYLTLNVKTIQLFFENINENEPELAEKTINVFPNPSVDVVRIQSKNTMQSLQLLNVNGQLISTWKVNDVQTRLDLSNVPLGVYWLKVQTEEGMTTEKLIVF